MNMPACNEFFNEIVGKISRSSACLEYLVRTGASMTSHTHKYVLVAVCRSSIDKRGQS